MKKIYFLIITGVLCLFFNLSSTSQVTVTNPANVGPAPLTATYTSLALAIAALNTRTTISGPVIITLNAGNPQTAISGGYAITAILAGASATNTVTIEGSANTITAFTPQTAGNLNDAIFKIIGSDYVIIQNFVMQENAANATTAAATNNMTEWGVALLKASTTDGAQNNTIQSNTISLKRVYSNTFGVYSNTRHNTTSVTATNDATSASGSNSFNKVYTNIISNIDKAIVFVSSNTAAVMDNGNDIGGSSAATGNTITNVCGLVSGAMSGYLSVTISSTAIQMNSQVGDNVSFNTITSATNITTLATNGLIGIFKSQSFQPTGLTFTSNYNNNTVTLTNAATTSQMTGIGMQGLTTLGTATYNCNNNNIINCSLTGAGVTTATIIGMLHASGPGTFNINGNTIRGFTTNTTTTGGFIGIQNQTNGVVNVLNINNNKIGDAVAGAITFNNTTTTAAVTGINVTATGAASTCALSISGNDFRGINYVTAGTGTHRYITNSSGCVSQTISNNTFNNLNVNTSGSVTFINRAGNMSASGVENCNNNSIVTGFNKSAAGGTVIFYNSLSLSVNGSTMTQTGNNFSNVTVTGATVIAGWANGEGNSSTDAPTKTITGNTFTNITGGSGLINIMEIDWSGNNSSVSSNTISNINGNGQVIGILYLGNNGQGTHSLSNNTITNLTSSGTGGLVIGLSAGATTIPTLNINSNSITALSTSGASAAVIGLQIVDGVTVNANSNIINTITGTGITDPLAAGITVAAGTTVNVGYNKIHTINQNGGIITTATGPVVIGLLFIGGSTINTHNNFVANLNAVNTAFADAIRGISVNSTTANSTYNLYYNSVHVNSASALATFGTSGIYHTTGSPATRATLNMIDNIIVNTSASAGVGRTAAYRRSSATLTNFAASSNYNLFYAGIPSATNLIFYDGTNSDQTLAAYQTRVAPRDANSISAFPNFVSSTDLHLTTDNCSIDNKGTPIAGYTLDIDNQTRHVSVPDLGADEFSSTPGNILYNTVGTTITDTRTVTTTEIFRSPACELFATLQPNGGNPVSGSVTARVYKYATVQTFFGEPYLQRVIDITPASGAATATGRVTFYYTQQEFTDFNTASGPWPDLPTGPADASGISNFRFTKYGGAPTVTPPAPYQYAPVVAPLLINPPDGDIVWNATFSRWEVTVDITGFSGFYVHTNNLFVLPITVNYLTGLKQGSNHLLNWKVTCNSTTRATMTLERSDDSRNYSGIYTITADAARCNQPFDYTDANPLKGINYYRLKMVDADGKVTYSTTVALLNAVKGFYIISIAPNPVVGNYVNLNITSAIPVKTELQITDMQGRTVKRFTIPLAGGFNTIPLDVKNLAAGTYNISGIAAGENLKQMRFVKQ